MHQAGRALAKPVCWTPLCVPLFREAQQEFVCHMFALSHLPENWLFSLWNTRSLPPSPLSRWHINLNCPICPRVSHILMKPHMIICIKFGHSVLLTCLMLIWLVQPEEFGKVGGKFIFPPPHHKPANYTLRAQLPYYSYQHCSCQSG